MQEKKVQRSKRGQSKAKMAKALQEKLGLALFDKVWVFPQDVAIGGNDPAYKYHDVAPSQWVIIHLADTVAVIRPPLKSGPQVRDYIPRVVRLELLFKDKSKALEEWARKLLCNADIKAATANGYYDVVKRLAAAYPEFAPVYESWKREGKVPQI